MAAGSVLDAILRRVDADPQRAAAILEESDSPFIAFDAKRIIRAANEAAERLLGHSRGALVGESADVLVPARFRTRDAPPPTPIPDVTTVELPALRSDGSEVMTVWSYAGVEAARFELFILTLRERSQLQSELETTTYATIFEHSPVPVALSRMPDGVLVAVNQAFAELFEVRKEDVLGRPSDDLGIATAEQRDEIARLLEERSSVRELECERRTAAGKRIHLLVSITRVRVGGVEHLLSTVQDISLRKEQEAALTKAAGALAETRARADYAVRLSGIGFWYCDLPFDELIWDARVKEHFFLPRDARVTIDTFYERIVEADRERTRAAIDASIRGRTLYDVQYRTHDPATGAVKWIRAMGGTDYAADGTPVRFDGVTVDVTSQKLDEERFASTAAQLEEANRVKDEFLAMLGHELRNPLAPITTAVQLLKRRRVESRELEIIDRQARHLTRLVDDLLDVSRITRGKVSLEKQICELSELVAAAIETVSPAIQAARHTLVTDVPARGLAIDVDRMRIVQVLSNLLTNAVKYTPPNGRIRISARRDGGDVVLRVEDDGEGIPGDLLPDVFDMFVQARQTLARSQGGLGLGLAIVKSLVTMHGGRVAAESEGPGHGSAFTLWLPAADAAPSAADARAPSTMAAPDKKRVLVVDDNVDSAELISEALRMSGYDTVMAHDGKEAIAVADAFRPDVALVDIGLPLVDGYEVARRLQSTHPKAILIAVTGYGQPEDRLRTRDAGFREHLTKPIDLDELVDALDRAAAQPHR